MKVTLERQRPSATTTNADLEQLASIEMADAPLPGELVLIGGAPHRVQDRMWTYNEALNCMSVNLLIAPMQRARAEVPGVGAGVILGGKP